VDSAFAALTIWNKDNVPVVEVIKEKKSRKSKTI
jgi:hypothetical protein